MVRTKGSAAWLPLLLLLLLVQEQLRAPLKDEDRNIFWTLVRCFKRALPKLLELLEEYDRFVDKNRKLFCIEFWTPQAIVQSQKLASRLFLVQSVSRWSEKKPMVSETKRIGKLEQLRCAFSGRKDKVVQQFKRSHAIDTPNYYYYYFLSYQLFHLLILIKKKNYSIC